MAKIGIELPGELVELCERQANRDGHTNRSAVVRKAVTAFFSGSRGEGAGVATAPTSNTTPAAMGIDLPDELVVQIDRQAAADGHKNRSAVIRKALLIFFAA